MSPSAIHRLFARVVITLIVLAVPYTAALATERAEAEDAIAQAKVAHERAASVNAASPETAEMIQEAESLLPSRQYTKAVSIASKALAQDSYAYVQTTAAGAGSGDSGPAKKAEQAIQAAEAARQKAAAVNGEWRDTAKLIEEAEQLAKSGSFDEAIRIANQAMLQGELGYEQAMAEKDAGFPDYVLKR